MEKTLKLSIVLPEQQLSQHSIDFIHWCHTNPQIELVCFIWTTSKYKSLKNFIEHWIWKKILFIERLKLKIKRLTKNDLVSQKKSLGVIQIFDLATKNEEVIKQIQDLEIDLHICLSEDINPESLKDYSRLGVLCVQGKSSNNLDKKPYFFEEILNAENKTTFNIICLEPNKRNPILLMQGSFVTHGYFLANQENIFLRQNFYIQKVLQDLILKEIETTEVQKNIGINNQALAPSISYQAKYVLYLVSLIIQRSFAFFKSEDVWNVGIYMGDWKTLDFQKSYVIPNPHNHFLADPFVMSVANKNYCFVEDYDVKKSKGAIAVYELGQECAEMVGIALEESFHLSYPYLFQYDSKIYMLPESGDNNDIRLYEASEFPLGWKLIRIIKRDVLAVDSMIFEHEGRWWLFSNINPIGDRDVCSELSIFYSDNPINGDWLPHEKNPVIFDPSSARNGGIILEESSIYRVGQNQRFGTYGGGGFSVNKIIDLRPGGYQEESVLKVEPNFFEDIKGSHHFHSNGVISAFDFLSQKNS